MTLLADTMVSAEQQRSWGSLLDRCFPVPPGAHFFDDFPVWALPSSPSILKLGVMDGAQVVGSTGARLVQVKGVGKCALVGAVAIDPKYRGKGFASDLVTVARDWAFQNGASQVFLWGSEHTLYERLGFKLAGLQVRVSLAGLDLGVPAPYYGTGWTPSLYGVLGRRTGGIELTPSDLSWVEAHKNVKWFWLGASHSPTAYLALGKGIDLQGIVHEWGGEPEALRSLLAAVVAQLESSSLLFSPSLHVSYLSDVLKVPSAQLQKLQVEHLCMMALQEGTAVDEKNLWFWGLDGA